MPRYPLPGKTVLITGAAGGIGAACARALHARGANLVLAGRTASSVAALARELGGERTLPLSVDVTDRAGLDDAVARTVDRFGRLDVVFANAGAAPERPATLATVDPAEFERVVEVNLLGVWRTVRAALPQVVAQRGHVLVNASVYAYVNGTANAAYAASKAAVEQIARALRVELSPHGATAGVLYPGWVDTGLARPALGGDELATRMREAGFPRVLAAAIDAEAVAGRVVRGVERRTASITVPRRWQPVGILRGMVNPLCDRLLSRDTGLRRLLRALEDGTSGAAPSNDAPAPGGGPAPAGSHGAVARPAPRRAGPSAGPTPPEAG
ncbi:3-phenylpropionate-dihydrodiol_cinnamic acid-dihydrodiol dehydrogenase [Streptomyces sp. enrichment culture]|uniref:short-chain dehydrogenase/reductase n=1 Tax=Streptomyces sp. enrichment culture TaxID=1795815 RepID=UPI003F548356